MNKQDVLAKIEEYKNVPYEIGLADEGVVLHGNVEGHWIFNKGDQLIEIKVNTADGTYGFSNINQKENPFKVTTINFDTINYIRGYINNKKGSIADALNGLTPIGTSLTLSEIQTAMESNSIRKAKSPSGNLNDPHVAPDGEYGAFKGSIVGVGRNAIPKYVTDKLIDED